MQKKSGRGKQRTTKKKKAATVPQDVTISAAATAPKLQPCWYGVPVAVIAGVWCLFLLLNSSFSHSYYDDPGMSISKAPPACTCFEELFKVLLKTVA
jgi:hypothetical protein